MASSFLHVLLWHWTEEMLSAKLVPPRWSTSAKTCKAAPAQSKSLFDVNRIPFSGYGTRETGSQEESAHYSGIDPDGRDTVLELAAEVDTAAGKSSNSDVLGGSLHTAIDPDFANRDGLGLLDHQSYSDASTPENTVPWAL